MAETSIFNNKVSGAYTYAVQGAALNWGPAGGVPTTGVPILMENITIQYQRGMQTIYPINQEGSTYKQIDMVGIPTGTLSCQGIVGQDVATLKNFLEQASTTCGEGIVVSLKPFNISTSDKSSSQCAKVSNIEYTMNNVKLNTLVTSVQGAQNGVAMLRQQLQFSFTSLKVNG